MNKLLTAPPQLGPAVQCPRCRVTPPLLVDGSDLCLACDSLIEHTPTGVTVTTTEARALNGLHAVPIGELHPSPNNPREHLTDIEGLALSLRESGMIQPIIAQKVPGQDGYQIVAGHRRFAAALRLGWAKVPVIIRRDMLPDEELVAMLVENGQRAGLDPIEEARALNRLKSTGLSDTEIGRKIGRSNSYVWGRIKLLSLPVEEQEQLRSRTITIGAAVDKAKTDSGSTYKPRKGREKAAPYLSINHELGTKARARCQRLGHKSKGAKSVGGVACGECWESVIRADERQHLHSRSEERGRCVLCDVAHDPDRAAS